MSLNVIARIVTYVCFALTCGLAQAETYTGRVIHIADGDTITVLDSSRIQHKVRLTGIDAPEKHQAFGSVSSQHLADMVFGKTVAVETTKLDRYKRELGKVLVGDTDANLEQIKAGLAWHYKKYKIEQSQPDRQTYALAEERARANRYGLWQDTSPVPPWDFRHQHKH